MIQRHRQHIRIDDTYRLGWRYFTSTAPLCSSGSGRQYQPLDIAAFIDLNTIAPHPPIGESDAQDIIRPILEFVHRVNGDVNDEDFGNRSQDDTDSDHDEQPSTSNNHNLPRIDAFGTGKVTIINQEQSNMNITASDDRDKQLSQIFEHGDKIKCAACGYVLHLNGPERRDVHSYRHLYTKYKKHMSKHLKSQIKLQKKMKSMKERNRRKKRNTPLLNQGEFGTYERYRKARKELKMMKEAMDDEIETGVRKVEVVSRGDCLDALQRVGVQVTEHDNVRKSLEAAVNRWMGEVVRKHTDAAAQQPEEEVDATTLLLRRNKIIAEEEEDDSEESFIKRFNGVLLVYSKNEAFVPLLRRARQKGILAVSVSNEEGQTALQKSSDVALGPFGRWVDDDDDDDDKHDELSSDDDDDDTEIPHSEESALDGSEEEEEEGEEVFVLKEIPSGPTSLLSVSTSQSKKTLDDSSGFSAVPMSRVGSRFITIVDGVSEV